MNKWKNIIPLMLCGSLMACSSLNSVPAEKEATEPQPKVSPEIESVTSTTDETKVVNEIDANVADVKVENQPDIIAPIEQPTKPTFSGIKTADGKLIFGEEEWVYIPGLKQSFKARIDTGATTSSISATDIVAFERDGKDWVKFKVAHDETKSAEINLPVERWVKIRQSSADKAQKRAIVVAWIEIGHLKEKAEFTLADRNHLSYPVLIGRSLFRDMAVVDVSRKFVQPKVGK